MKLRKPPSKRREILPLTCFTLLSCRSLLAIFPLEILTQLLVIWLRILPKEQTTLRLAIRLREDFGSTVHAGALPYLSLLKDKTKRYIH